MVSLQCELIVQTSALIFSASTAHTMFKFCTVQQARANVYGRKASNRFYFPFTADFCSKTAYPVFVGDTGKQLTFKMVVFLPEKLTFSTKPHILLNLYQMPQIKCVSVFEMPRCQYGQNDKVLGRSKCPGVSTVPNDTVLARSKWQGVSTFQMTRCQHVPNDTVLARSK